MKHTQGTMHRNIKPATKYSTLFVGRNEHIAYMATAGRDPAQVEADMDRMLLVWNSHDDLRDALQHCLLCIYELANGADGDDDRFNEGGHIYDASENAAKLLKSIRGEE